MDEEAFKKHNQPEKGAAPGVYKHPETKEELHAASFTQADAYVRQGWEYDRPLPKREISTETTETTEGGETYEPTDNNKKGK